MLFGFGVEFFFAEHGQDLDLLHNLPHVFHGVDNVSRAGLALGANHGCALGDAAQGFSEIGCATYDRSRDSAIVDVVGFVGWSEHLGLVDVVDAQFLQDLRFGKMSDAAFGHHWDGDCGHDFTNLFGRGHAGYAASARICAGTRSRAMTATAPAFSAIVACSALVTSIMTPPFSISASPVFRRRLVDLPLLLDMGPLFAQLH